jgi:hypothetical protein
MLYAHWHWRKQRCLSQDVDGKETKNLGGGHSSVKILSYNPGHDGAIAYVKGAHLLVSVEAEKNSNYRYSPISSHDVFNVLGELNETPDVICTGGWWPREKYLRGTHALAGYRGVVKSGVIVDQRRLLGRQSTISRLLTSDRTYFAHSACQVYRKVLRAMR